jgi:hypothetical protein
MTLPRWTREPLVHFLAAGAAIFLLLAWRGEEADPASRTITVTREDRARLALQWERSTGRIPTDAELDALTERHVREEVLYREALRLGLDRDDAVLRKRLANKMDYLAESMAETAPVSDATLATWLKRHPERFAPEVRYGFDQLWFETPEEADAALARLEDEADWAAVGGRISLPPSVRGETRALLESRYGRQFVHGLDGLAVNGVWRGPVPSGFGWHLVRLTAREVGETPPLAEVREAVETDWRAETKARRKDDAYRLLLASYQVDIAR